MSSSLDNFLRRLRDPRWIPHISDYCDARCDRCAFTQRCWSYAVRQHAEGGPDPDMPCDEQDKAEQGKDEQDAEERPHVQGWAERHGIDLNEITMDASDEKSYER